MGFWAAALPFIAQAGSAILDGRSADRAADIQGNAARAAGDQAARAARQAREDLLPFAQGGQAAQNELLRFLGLSAPSAVPGSPDNIRSRLNDIPKTGVATPEDVDFVFREVVGRAPSNEEMAYYTGARSDPANPARNRLNELWQVVDQNIWRIPEASPVAQGVQGANVQSANDVQMEFLQNHPLFQSGLQNLNEQTNAFAAATGRFGAGDTATEIFENAMAAGAPLLQQRYNQLFNLATQGQNAAAGTGTATIQGANASGNALLASANARAAGRLGRADAFSRGIEGAAQTLPPIIDWFRNRDGDGFGGGSDGHGNDF